MYGTTKVNADSGPPRFNGGINQNVTLSSYQMETTKNGNEVFVLEFKNSGGGTFKWRMWPVDPKRVMDYAKNYPKTHKRDNDAAGIKAGETVTPEQALERAYDDFNRRIKHFLTKYVSDETANIGDTESYEDYASKITSILNSADTSTKMNLKLVYDKNNYLVIPLYGNFFETADTSPSTLSINPQYDKTTVDGPSSEDTVSAAVEEGETTNDLPF